MRDLSFGHGPVLLLENLDGIIVGFAVQFLLTVDSAVRIEVENVAAINNPWVSLVRLAHREAAPKAAVSFPRRLCPWPSC